MWFGPDLRLPAGTYTVTLDLRAWASDATQPPGANASVLAVNSNAFAQPLYYDRTFSYSALGGAGWTSERFSFSTSEPIIEFEVRGYSFTPRATVAVEYVSVVPGI
jgi:hypothetical protein